MRNSTRNTDENRAAYWGAARRFLLQYSAGLLVSSLLFRWSAGEAHDLLRDAMRAPAAICVFLGAFVGSTVCEVYFTMRGFKSEFRYAEDAFPRWYEPVKAVSTALGFVVAVLFVAGLTAL
jgi:hypothetical protein